ncbi:hypothetical protein [Asticcacaulis machinosus]|uniref:Uncharacterized protein n=1 Tax=Asticcacaulis machinosus TaxID=2984211 RepID=A0ABT5HH22_9CAUL|nr:hypothetical protein [Asticcacaulis machinosus]MDC7675555.1 hypothetical protein [Asticcacaulis machinosus]
MDIHPTLDIEVQEARTGAASAPFDVQKVLDELDAQMQRVRALQGVQARVARQASMDPDDGVEM